MSGQKGKLGNILKGGGSKRDYIRRLPRPSSAGGGGGSPNPSGGGGGSGGGGVLSPFGAMSGLFKFDKSLFAPVSGEPSFNDPHISNNCLRELVDGFLSKAYVQRMYSEVEEGTSFGKANVASNEAKINQEMLGHLKSPCQKAGIELWEWADANWDLAAEVLSEEFDPAQIIRLVGIKKANEVKSDMINATRNALSRE